MKLYEQVADQLAARVQNGVYSPGDRMPSVRRLSTQFDVSISTATQAYQVLEDRGLIEPRPQSGHYVRALLSAPPSPRISDPPKAPTAINLGKLALQVLRANEAPGVVPLGTAIPDIELPAVKQVHKILASLARKPDRRSTTYAIIPGLPELRLQIARRAVDSGCSLAPDDIIITNGCQEAIHLCLRAVAQEGDTVAIESPAFYGTLQTIETLGIRALEIPTDPQTGISLEALKLALEQWPIKACLLVPNFSNPLGCHMSDERKQTLLELLTEHDIPLIEDDIYGDLAYGNGRPKTVKAFDRDGRVLLCSSVSKTLAPGLRIGWVAPGRYWDSLEQLKYISSGATVTLPSLAVARFLEGGGYDRHLRMACNAYRQYRDRFTELVARYFPPGTRATRPEGGFVMWVELPDTVDALELCRQALARNISITPGPLFSSTGKYRHFIRLNYARPVDERTIQAMQALGVLVQQLL